MKRITHLSRVIILFLIGFTLFISSAGATGKSFSDYQSGAFGYDEVTYLVDKGIIQGYEDQTFKPNRNINRGQTAVMFQRALGLEASVAGTSFVDVPVTSTYAEAAAAAKAAGIFTGKVDGSFGPADLLTREQMASVLVRAFGLQPAADAAVTIPDQNKVSPSHLENVKVLFQNGVTTGRANGMFDPKGFVTRAQFSVFMHRALELQKEEVIPEEVPKPVEEVVELEITDSKLRTTNKTVSSDISSSGNDIELTFDLSKVSDEDKIVSGSIKVSADSTFTVTKIPSPINLFVPVGEEQELSEGENKLSFAEEIGATGIKFKLIREFFDEFEVGATLEDENGDKKDLTIRFILK